MTERQFPIMHDQALKSIPWAVIHPHERQAKANHHQDLTQLAARGGLTPCEALAVIEGRPWERMPFGEARQKLVDYVRGATGQPPTALEDLTELSRLLVALRDGKLTERRATYNKALVLVDRVRGRIEEASK